MHFTQCALLLCGQLLHVHTTLLGASQGARGVAQVLACSKGQQREEGLIRQLVDTAVDARKAAGTLGKEQTGTTLPDSSCGSSHLQVSALACKRFMWDLHVQTHQHLSVTANFTSLQLPSQVYFLRPSAIGCHGLLRLRAGAR